MDTVDILKDLVDRKIDILDGDTGFVKVVDCMPRLVPVGLTADYAIVQAARTSYGQGTKQVSEDRNLLRYLLRHRHTSPFEMGAIKFHLRMPVFIYRQLFRHRTASINDVTVESNLEFFRKFITMNEYSARYSEVPDLTFVPHYRLQSASNKQGGAIPVSPEDNEELRRETKENWDECYALYKKQLSKGVSRELARAVLPVSSITEFYLTVDLWNFMHFLSLRCDDHAQAEIMMFAHAMAGIMKQIFPISYEAWDDYMFSARTFSKTEVTLLRRLISQTVMKEIVDSSNLSEREKTEFVTKIYKDSTPVLDKQGNRL